MWFLMNTTTLEGLAVTLYPWDLNYSFAAPVSRFCSMTIRILTLDFTKKEKPEVEKARKSVRTSPAVVELCLNDWG